MTVHGIGPKVARELYDRYDCRTLEDVYAAKPESGFKMEVEYWGELQSRYVRLQSGLLATDSSLTRPLSQDGTARGGRGGGVHRRDARDHLPRLHLHNLRRCAHSLSSVLLQFQLTDRTVSSNLQATGAGSRPRQTATSFSLTRPGSPTASAATYSIG